jgi:transposase-like protein
MDFTQEQITQILSEFSTKKNDGFQTILKIALEALMRSEREEFNLKEVDVSNGYRSRSVLSNGVSLELAVPRTRHQNFYPLILALIKDQNEELAQITTELYSSGLTTEQIGGIVEKIYGRHYSKSSISSMMQSAKADVSSWLNRKLDSKYPVVYIDAIYWFTRRGNAVSSEAYYTILGVKTDRTREVLSVVNHPTESSENWTEIFEALKSRGVEDIQLIVSDGLAGIENAAQKVFPQVKNQLCTVHLKRSITAKAKPVDKKQIAEELKQVFDPKNQADNQTSGFERYIAFMKKWEKKYPSFKNMQTQRYSLYFTYLNYHVEVRRMIYTTNWIERLNRNYKRVLRMRNSMPSPESVLFLMGSVAMRRNEFNYPIHQFIYDSKLFS